MNHNLAAAISAGLYHRHMKMNASDEDTIRYIIKLLPASLTVAGVPEWAELNGFDVLLVYHALAIKERRQQS